MAVCFQYVGDGVLAQLGSHLFAWGALKFTQVGFDEEGMADLINGFRRSGHAGGILQTLMFAECNLGYDNEWKDTINSDAKGASLALIAGLRDRIFPNLEYLWAPYGALLVLEVPKLVKMLSRGAPCARTLRTVVLSERFLGPANIEPLQAAIPQATVTLE